MEALVESLDKPAQGIRWKLVLRRPNYDKERQSCPAGDQGEMTEAGYSHMLQIP